MLDEEFHRSLASASGCTYAWKVIESAKAQMDRVRFLSLPEATPMRRLIAQHKAVLDGIAAGRQRGGGRRHAEASARNPFLAAAPCREVSGHVRCRTGNAKWSGGVRQAWRWYGPDDPVTLDHVRQAGAHEIVTALHQYAPGEVWPRAAVAERKAMIENTPAGRVPLKWTVVESIPVPDDIQREGAGARRSIEVWIESMRAVAAEGIRTICYNVMPVVDWTRTDLDYPDADRRNRAALRLRPLRGLRSACAQAQERGSRLRRGDARARAERSPTRCRRAKPNC